MSGKVRRTTPQELLGRIFPPMLAALAASIPEDAPDYLLELKYDGFRALAAVVEGDVAVWSRNRLDLAARFPFVGSAVGTLDVGEAVLDGEIVALDSRGAPRFELLQRGELHHGVFVVFDLLWLNGRDLRNQPIEIRRELLEALLREPPRQVEVAERLSGPARRCLEESARRGYEGLIAKRRGSHYEKKRSKAWLKLKVVDAQEVAIVGYTPANNDPKQIGALLVGVMQDGEMTFAGKVGTGYSLEQRRKLMKELSGDRIVQPAVNGAPRMKNASWVEPRLVAQVRFTEWTADGKLRHPSFLGLRPDKKPGECIREVTVREMEKRGKRSGAQSSSARPAGRKTTSSGGKRAGGRSSSASGRRVAVEVPLTHPERVLYPRDGITKQDVAEYFRSVSDAIIPALIGRPLALEHWNQGIDHSSWFQQSIGRDAEPWMTTVDTPARTSEKTIEHLIVDRPETLRWLAQRSVLTLHMWSSRAEHLESPDWLIFDLDPAKGKGIEQSVEAAIVLRRLFEQMDLPSVPKTSGKRGIHILVPLLRGSSHDDAVEFACTISETVASRVEFITVERALAKRKGRLYLDCLQNGYGKTIVAPYSLRAVDGAPVSAPLEWSEVNRRLDPAKFNLRSMPARLEKKGDLFRRALEGGVKLPRLR